MRVSGVVVVEVWDPRSSSQFRLGRVVLPPAHWSPSHNHGVVSVVSIVIFRGTWGTGGCG